MHHSSGHSIRLSIGAMLLVFATGATSVSADEAAYQSAMAKAIRTAATRVLPSVVSVEVVGAVGVADSADVDQDAPTSGLIIDSDGYVITSNLVVRRPSASLLVLLGDGTRYAAEVISQDERRDLVLLKIEPKTPLTPIELPDTLSELKIGQTTIAVGRYGNDAAPIVSSGVLSAVDRLEGIALQTDARVSPAFYGGPLINLRGEVLGVLIPAVAEGAAENPTDWYDSGIAFAIPADVIVSKLDRLRAGETLRKGLIGIVPKSKDPYESNTEIGAVRARSPAESAGLKPGDEIVAIDGNAVRRHQEILQALGRYDAGETIELSIRRDGESRQIEITLAESIPPLQPQRLGLIVSERQRGEAGEIVIDAVLPDTPASDHLKAGDVLLRIGETQLDSLELFRRQMVSATPGETIKITLRRDDEDQQVGKEQQVEMKPASLAGPILDRLPEIWDTPAEEDWIVESLELPDVANEAVFVGPGEGQSIDRLGLLVLLLNPGEGSPQDAAAEWTAAAQASGTVVLIVAPEDNRRWQQDEIDVVTRFAAASMKQAAIDPSAVAVAAAGALSGGKAEAADSMALAAAVARSKTFFGVAVSDSTRPPAIRLRENEADASLQVLLPLDAGAELPTWATRLIQGGYPIVRGGEVDRGKLLRWTRLLQSL